MYATTPSLLDEIDITAADERLSRVESREAVRRAIMRTAAEHGGLVHIAQVREHLPTWCNPQQVGAVTCQLVRQGYLTPTGRYRANGGEGSRNRTKQSEVRRLARPIPPEAVA